MTRSVGRGGARRGSPSRVGRCTLCRRSGTRRRRRPLPLPARWLCCQPRPHTCGPIVIAAALAPASGRAQLSPRARADGHKEHLYAWLPPQAPGTTSRQRCAGQEHARTAHPRVLALRATMISLRRRRAPAHLLLARSGPAGRQAHIWPNGALQSPPITDPFFRQASGPFSFRQAQAKQLGCCSGS